MGIIDIIINIDNIRQERPNVGTILKLNKRLKEASLKTKFDTQALRNLWPLRSEKIGSIAFLKVELLAENPYNWLKTEYSGSMKWISKW